MQLILASASPRRRKLLGLFGIPFVIRAADIDETMDPQRRPFDEVARVSRAKALAVPHGKDDVVVAADTIGAGIGEMVIVTTDETTQHALDHAAPLDAFIVGIVDNPPVLGR